MKCDHPYHSTSNVQILVTDPEGRTCDRTRGVVCEECSEFIGIVDKDGNRESVPLRLPEYSNRGCNHPTKSVQKKQYKAVLASKKRIIVGLGNPKYCLECRSPVEQVEIRFNPEQ
jgi:hypothetical protein